MKVKFNPNKLDKNPIKSFDIYTQKVLKAAQKKIDVNKPAFANELYELGDRFESQSQKALLNKKANNLAETLVSLKNNDLAGVIYSFLIKFNQGNPLAIEEFSTKALAIAVRLNDPIHIMARAHNLKEFYKIVAPQSEKFLKVLYQEKRALNTIVNNYDKVKSNQKTILREMKSLENYKQTLAAVKLEIAEVLLNKDKNLARKELVEALELYQQFGFGKNTEKIQKLLEIAK